LKVSILNGIRSRAVALFPVIVLLCAASGAATLTGTVRNLTTGKPSAGDEVSLLALSQGMSEAGKTKTNAQGRYTFEVADAGIPHLVRVNHQGVNYFSKGGPLAPGTATADVEVYDAATKLDGINTKVQAMRLQGESGTLSVMELYAVVNTSQPPRALMSDRTYTIQLPEGAQIEQASAAGPGGMPINASPVPGSKKGEYYFAFPLRPGETRFQIAYQMPYSGDVTLDPKPNGSLEHLAVLLPKSMRFEAKTPGSYAAMPDEGGQTAVQVATGVKPGQDVSFHLSGTGSIAEEGGGQGAASGPSGAPPSGGGAEQATARPGGGLGAPEGTPGPLDKYRWVILGGLGTLLLAGGVYVATRGKNASEAATGNAGPARPPAGNQKQSILEALKEELFQLEMDRQQGRITPEQYAKSKAALDHTLQRAAARMQGSRK
jgi:hypothetical protein